MLRTLLIFLCVMIKFIQRDEKYVIVAITIYVTSYLINKVLLHKLGTSKTRLQEDKQSRMWDSMVAVGQDSKLCASFCLMRIKKFLSWRNTFLSNYSSGVFQLVTATFCVSIIDLLTLAISDCCLEEIESMRIMSTIISRITWASILISTTSSWWMRMIMLLSWWGHLI